MKHIYMVPSCLDVEATKKAFHTAYIQQQLHYDAAQVLHIVAISQLLTLILECLVKIILLSYFHKVASCVTRGIKTLSILHSTCSTFLGPRINHNFGSEFSLAIS